MRDEMKTTIQYPCTVAMQVCLRALNIPHSMLRGNGHEPLLEVKLDEQADRRLMRLIDELLELRAMGLEAAQRQGYGVQLSLLGGDGA